MQVAGKWPKPFPLSKHPCNSALDNEPKHPPTSPIREPESEMDGPLSLSLSPFERQRVPKAGEGAVQGFKTRIRSGNSLPQGHTSTTPVPPQYLPSTSPDIQNEYLGRYWGGTGEVLVWYWR
jgi:hypothetical protein